MHFKISRRILVLILPALAFSMLILAGGHLSAAEDIVVDSNGNGDHTSIQDGIDAAAKGDTIRVWAGEYNENIVIAKSLNIMGNGSTETFIDGDAAYQHGVFVNAEWVNLSGLVIENWGRHGIRVDTGNATIKSCNSSNNGRSGVAFTTVSNSGYNTITNSVFSDNGNIGIMIESPIGHNTIAGCTVTGNTNDGISVNEASGNQIRFTTISGNKRGILAKGGARDLLVRDCNILVNLEEGVEASGNDGVRINVTGNWWGHDSGPYHEDDNPGGLGSEVTGNLDFDPWLLAPFDYAPKIIFVATYGDDLTGNGSSGNPFRTVQKGIDSARNGDIVKVYAGLYEENVLVNRSVSLMANGSEVTTIQGSETTDVVMMSSPWASISGFTVTGSGASHAGIMVNADFCRMTNNFLNDNYYGIELYGAENATLTGNNLQNNFNGIYLRQFSHRAIIRDTHCQSNEQNGIHLFRSGEAKISEYHSDSNSYALLLVESSRNKISHIVSNGERTIALRLVDSHDNRLENISCLDSGSGISLGGSDRNNISRITVEDMNYGAWLQGESVDNEISDARFTNCEYGIKVSGDSHRNIFAQVNISDCQENGIRVESSNNLTFKDLTVYLSRKAGVYLSRSHSGSLENLSVLEGDAQGLWFSQSDGNTIREGRYSGNLQGLVLASSQENDFQVTEITDNEAEGINLSHFAENNSFRLNSITGNHNGIVQTQDAKNNVFRNNLITGNQGMGAWVLADNVPWYDLDMRRNNWGTDFGPHHPVNNSKGQGDKVSDHVLFDPWLGKENVVKYAHDDAPDGGNGSMDHPYNNIQDAIEDITQGGTVHIWEGDYSGNILIEKTLDILGNGSGESRLMGQLTNRHGVHVTADWVNLSGLGVHNWIRHGIELEGSHIRIENCRAVNNALSGLDLSASSQAGHNTILNSSFTRNGNHGILIESLVGNNTIMGCHVEENNNTGIVISGASDNLIQNCFILDNKQGVSVHDGSEDVVVRNCSIMGNEEFGIVASGNQEENVDATGNWWGTDFGPWEEELNPDGRGDTVTSYVLYDPWLGKENLRKYVDYQAPGDGDGSMAKPFNNIQDAVDAVTEGGWVHVWAGSYFGKVMVNRTLSIIGNGSGETILYGQGEAVSGVVLNASHANLTGLGVRGWNENGIQVPGNWCSFTDVNASENLKSGIQIEGENCTVESGSFWLNGASGIYLFGTVNTTILENQCHRNERSGIELLDSSLNLIRENHCSGNNEGARLQGSGFNTLENNTFSENKGYGIYLTQIDPDKANRLENNTFNFNSAHGVFLSNADGTLLMGNTVNFNKADGISLLLSSSVTVEGGDCSFNGGRGIYFSGSSRCEIIDVSLLSNEDAGLYIHNSHENTISDTAITGSPIGIYCGVSSDNSIDDSTIQDNTLFGMDLSNNPGRAFSAKNIWWGSEFGPYHETENPYGRGDNITGGVIFRPWVGQDVRHGPVITSQNPETAAIEDEPYSFRFAAEDEDILPYGETLNWYLITGPDWLDLDPETGLLFGTPANKDVAIYRVNVGVEDDEGFFDNLSFLLGVTNVNDPPSIITRAPPLSVREDDSYFYQFEATDPDKEHCDSIHWVLTTDAGWLVLDDVNGTLTGTPGDEDVGVFTVNITAEDCGLGEDWLEYSLTVLNVNDRPQIEITSPVADETLAGAYLVEGSFSDVDPDDDLLVQLKVDGGEWQDVTLEQTRASSGNWSFQWKTFNYQNGRHKLTARVMDDTLEDETVVSLVLANLYDDAYLNLEPGLDDTGFVVNMGGSLDPGSWEMPVNYGIFLELSYGKDSLGHRTATTTDAFSLDLDLSGFDPGVLRINANATLPSGVEIRETVDFRFLNPVPVGRIRYGAGLLGSGSRAETGALGQGDFIRSGDVFTATEDTVLGLGSCTEPGGTCSADPIIIGPNDNIRLFLKAGTKLGFLMSSESFNFSYMEGDLAFYRISGFLGEPTELNSPRLDLQGTSGMDDLLQANSLAVVRLSSPDQQGFFTLGNLQGKLQARSLIGGLDIFNSLEKRFLLQGWEEAQVSPGTPMKGEASSHWLVEIPGTDADISMNAGGKQLEEVEDAWFMPFFIPGDQLAALVPGNTFLNLTLSSQGQGGTYSAFFRQQGRVISIESLSGEGAQDNLFISSSGNDFGIFTDSPGRNYTLIIMDDAGNREGYSNTFIGRGLPMYEIQRFRIKDWNQLGSGPDFGTRKHPNIQYLTTGESHGIWNGITGTELRELVEPGEEEGLAGITLTLIILMALLLAFVRGNWSWGPGEKRKE